MSKKKATEFYLTTFKGYRCLSEKGCIFVDKIRAEMNKNEKYKNAELPDGTKITVRNPEGFEWGHTKNIKKKNEMRGARRLFYNHMKKTLSGDSHPWKNRPALIDVKIQEILKLIEEGEN